jgi:hypothetical protein
MTIWAIHVQKHPVPAWLKQFAKAAGITHAVIMQPHLCEPEPFGPDVTHVGRLYWGGEPDKELVWEGASGANAYWSMCYPALRQAMWIDCWQGPNEPGFTNLAQNREEAIAKAGAWSEFTERACMIWNASGRKMLAGPFSTGTPERGLVPYLAEGIAACDGLALHQYGMKTMTPISVDHLRRHEMIQAELRALGYTCPPIYILESGVDYSGNPTKDGWKAQGISGEEYAKQQVAYVDYLERDPQVKMVAFFTHLPDGWPSFELDKAITETHLLPALQAHESVQQQIAAFAQRYVIPQNPAAAFYAYGRAKGWEPISPEFDYQGQRAQVWYSPGDKRQHVCCCRIGDWGNIRHIDRAN